MTEFDVKSESLLSASENLKRIQNELKEYSSEVRSVATRLDFRLSAAGMLRFKLNNMSNSLIGCSNKSMKMSDVASSVAELYTNAENTIATGEGEGGTGDVISDIESRFREALEDIFGEGRVIDGIKDGLVDAFQNFVGRLDADEWQNLLGGIIDTASGLPIIAVTGIISDLVTGNADLSTATDLIQTVGGIVIGIHPVAGLVISGAGSLIGEFPEYWGEMGDAVDNFKDKWSEGDYLGAIFEGYTDVALETQEYIVESALDLVDSIVPISAVGDGIELLTGIDVDGIYNDVTSGVENFFDEITDVDNIREWGAGLADMLGF